jgi:hypothetical protein
LVSTLKKACRGSLRDTTSATATAANFYDYLKCYRMYPRIVRTVSAQLALPEPKLQFNASLYERLALSLGN